MNRIELGDRVKDRITGLKGIAIGITEWLYSCRRIVVQPETTKDHKPIESFCVDEPQLTLVRAGVIVPPNRSPVPTAPAVKTGGPHPIPARQADPTR